MVNTQQAQIQLDELKHGIIGIFKNKLNGVFEMVTDIEGDDNISTIYISSFGAIQENYNFPIHYGTLHLFPDNKNMNDMLNSPFEWDAFMKQF